MADGNYANRTDLQNAAGKIAVSAAKGQTYGAAGQQIAAQRAVPMGQAPTDVQPQRPVPGTLGGFTRPTERPLEPITAGANFGPGPSAMQAGIPLMQNPRMQAIEELRAIYAMYPTEDLGDLLNAFAEENQ